MGEIFFHRVRNIWDTRGRRSSTSALPTASAVFMGAFFMAEETSGTPVAASAPLPKQQTNKRIDERTDGQRHHIKPVLKQ